MHAVEHASDLFSWKKEISYTHIGRKMYQDSEFKVTHAHCIDGQALYSSGSRMWRGRRSSVCLHALWPARTQVARTPERGLLPLPTHLHPTSLCTVQGPDSSPSFGRTRNAHGRVMMKNYGKCAGKCPRILVTPWAHIKNREIMQLSNKIWE